MNYLIGALIAVFLLAAAEAYVLLGRMQLFLTYAEQIGAALGLRLAARPSKSAARTDGSRLRPHRWFGRLRQLDGVPEPEETPARPTPYPRTQPDGIPANGSIKQDRLSGPGVEEWLAKFRADQEGRRR